MSIPASPPRRCAVRVYWQLALCAFQRCAVYRLANVTGIAVNFFFFLVHAQVFLAFFEGRGRVAGYDGNDAVLYFAASESLMMVIGIMSASTNLKVAERVRSGDIAVDLARPLRLWRRHLAEAYGSGAYYLIARATVLYGAAVWLFELDVPLRAELMCLPVAVVLAIAAASLAGYVAAASAYWIEGARGPISATLFASLIFGGVFVPIDFYPDAVRSVCAVLPFRAMAHTPLAIAAGRLSGHALANAMLHQMVWVTLLCAAAHAAELLGTRRLAAVGG